MKKVKKVGMFVLFFIMVGGVLFAQAPANFKNRTIRIGWAPPDITGVFKTATNFMELAAKDAKKYGLDVQIITKSTTSHTAAAEQVTIIENFIQQKVDALIVSPVEVEAVKPVLKEVNKAGIPLILVNMLDEQPGIKVDNFVGFDNAQAAMVSAYATLDALGGPGVLGKGKMIQPKSGEMLDLKWWQNLYKDVPKSSISGNVATIEGIAGDFFSNERLKGYHAVIDQYPGVKVVQSLPANWNRQDAVTATENILQNQKNLDVIWASCAEMALGASAALENANRKNVLVLSNDGTPETIQAIKDGKILAESWHGFPEWGWYGVKFAVMLALGEDVPLKYDIRPRTEYKGNADDFYPNPKLEAIDWVQIMKAAKK